MTTIVGYMQGIVATERTDRQIVSFLFIRPLLQIKRTWARLRREYRTHHGPLEHDGVFALLPFDFVHYQMLPVVLRAFEELRANIMRAALVNGHVGLPAT